MSSYWSDLKNALLPQNDPPQQLLSILLAVVAPLGCALTAMATSWSLTNAAVVLSPLAIVAAGQLTAFVYLANLRLKMSEHVAERPKSESPDRRMIDTAVAGVLAGAVVSASSALIIALVSMIATGPDDSLNGFAAISIMGLTAFSFGLFTANLPNLWSAYQQAIRAEERRPNVHR